MLFAPEAQEVVGLVEQSRWTRDITTRGKRRFHAVTPYEEKEGYKWELASRAMMARLGDKLNNVISVCDREADIYEYLRYKLDNQQRFVVRSLHNRHLESHSNKLYHLASELQTVGERTIELQQKGGRKARQVKLNISFAPVSLKVPNNKTGDALPLYYVGCAETDNPNSKLNWHLLTSEPITTAEDAIKVIRYYEQRWLVEELHKAWKSDGTDIESSRLQSQANLERMATILAFIAVRILQLKFAQQIKDESSCESLLSQQAWKLLWLKTVKTPLPKTPPTKLWLYQHIAKLGGFKDTKRTGRASVKTLWQGWLKLQTILEGYELAKLIQQLEPDL